MITAGSSVCFEYKQPIIRQDDQGVMHHVGHHDRIVEFIKTNNRFNPEEFNRCQLLAAKLKNSHVVMALNAKSKSEIANVSKSLVEARERFMDAAENREISIVNYLSYADVNHRVAATEQEEQFLPRPPVVEEIEETVGVPGRDGYAQLG